MRTLVPFLLLCAACAGDDGGGGGDPVLTDTGGTREIAGCGCCGTTRLGAEPPRKATDTRGADPAPRHVHRGFVGDPKTSMVVQWRTKDETTRITEIRYAAGADLREDQLTE